MAGSRDIWWKERIYDRPIERGRRQTIIHLLNAPVEECVTRAKYTPPPPVQEGVRVSLEAPKGMVLEKAYAMRPEIPQPWKDTSERTSNQDPGFQRADFIKDSRLEASQSGSRIAVSVPRLEYWTMVVFQWKPWGG